MPMPDERTCRTRAWKVLTDPEIEALADEAERGYDVALLRKARRGRPPMGSGPAEVVPVRLDPDLRRAAEARAEAEETTLSEVIRRALRRYVGAA
jgi:predicted HicB family RNase H-like nuclease